MGAIKYQSRFTSLNGESFVLELWDKNHTGLPDDQMAVGEGGPVISYDSQGDKKFNDICASTMEWPYTIKNVDDEQWVEDLIIDGEEQDVYVHLYQYDPSGDLQYIWGGFLLMDLSTTPDISFPYDVSFRAIDGLALLKEKKWLLSTATGYTEADTYIPTNKQTFIYWFKEILAKAGAAQISNGASKDYGFATVNRWYNENHEASSILTQDPTAITLCHTRGFYALKDNGDYEPDDTYAVLTGMIRSWGMRVVYWMGDYYFIQVNEYITQQSGNAAVPNDMDTHFYDKTGTLTSNSNHIGIQLSRYQVNVNTGATYGSVGLQKLEGSEYTYLPAIKNSLVEFESIEDINYFQGYPDMFTVTQFNNASGSTTGTPKFNSKPLSIWTDAHNGGGWYFYLVMDLVGNVTTQQWGAFCYLWTVRAREVGTTPWMHMLNFDTGTNTLSWGSYASYWGAWANISINDIINATGNFTGGGVDCKINILPNSNSYSATSLIFDSGSTTNGKIPPPSWTATGDWEFELATAMIPVGATGSYNGMNPVRRGYGNQGTGWSNQNTPPGIGLPYGFAASVTANTQNMSIQYSDSIGAPFPNGAINYNSVYSAIMTASNNIGFTLQSTFVSTTTTDSKTNVIKGVKYGDTTSPNAPGTLWVVGQNSGTIGATEPTGLWDRNINGGTDTFSEVLAKQVINNQYHANPQINGTFVLSKENKYEVLSGQNYIKAINPLCRIVDRDATPYVMMRMAWSCILDEWSGEWWQVINSNVNTTTTTGNGGPGNGNGGPTPDDPIGAGLAPPISQSGTQSKIGVFNGTNYQELGKDKFIITTISADIPATESLTTLPIFQTLENEGSNFYWMKAGMKLRLVDNNYLGKNALKVYDIVVSADQTSEGSLSIESMSISNPINKNARLEVDVSELMIKAFQSQTEISLTTTGTSGASTFNSSTGALNIPNYASGGGSVNANYMTYKCSTTTTTSTTAGEINSVVIPFDTSVATSTVNDITFYDNSGPGDLSNGAYTWKFATSGNYEISWNVGTNTNLVNNRILTGVKLQYGSAEGETIGWTDINPSHGYIYDRGTGSVRKGSVSMSTILRIVVSETPVYYRVVFWKEASSNAGTNSITLLNSTNLTIKQLQ